ncbi:hypothetical protein [Polaromonas sp.]|uniref:hypothetical protein n=1 Tax=Polaromonas sp. TaxID=1869339 RepID=UPI003264EA24
MKSNIIPLATAQHVAPASDGVAIAQALKTAINEFGATNLAMALVEPESVDRLKAA